MDLRRGAGTGGVLGSIVGGETDAGVSADEGGGVGSGRAGARLSSVGSSCMMELIRGGRLTSALGAGWADGGAGGGL